MTISDLYEKGLIRDNTVLYLLNDSGFFTSGNWYQDNIIPYLETLLVSFTWQDDFKVFLDIEI